MNFLSVLFILATLAIYSHQAAVDVRSDHNLINCPKPENATLVLHQEKVTENGIFLGHRKVRIVFPNTGINQVLITCLMVQDLAGDDTGGYPAVIDGGVGYYFVEIELTSQLGRGLNFNVAIYGDKA